MTTNTTMTAGQRAAADLTALLRARNSLILIVTREEARAERCIFDACAAASMEPRVWDCGSGISDMAGRPVDEGAVDPVSALNLVKSAVTRQAWIMRDLLDQWLDTAPVRRLLRNLARALPQAPRDQARSIIMVSPRSEVPPELQGHVTVMEWPLPDRNEIAAVLDAQIEVVPEELRAQAAPNGVRDAAIDAAVGLTEIEASACYRKSLVSTRKIDPAIVAGEKKRVIAREKVLEWIDPLPGGLDAVGGLDDLKTWLGARRAAFTAKARAYGLPAPKGMLLVGPPGTGKSLTAKCVATAWGMPLLRFDFGALKGKFVGESEGKIRQAQRVAQSIAPCVVWIDEIEKGLAGASQGASDGGVSADALGSFLGWMQDQVGVFVIATANDVSALPPELLRKGRFDDLFFVDLPNAGERASILRAALRANGRDVNAIDLGEVSRATVDFVGAEIAALVPEAMYAAFGDGERPITTADLVSAAKRMVPLAKTAPEKIERVRTWAKGRARRASAPEEKTSGGKAGALDL